MDTGLKLRTAAPSGDWRSFIVTAPSGGVVQGQADLVHDTVGVYMQDADAGEDVAFCYHAEKVEVPKRTGSSYGILEAGDKVYFDHAAADFSSDTSGNLLAGICLKAAGAADTVVLIDLLGNRAT